MCVVCPATLGWTPCSGGFASPGSGLMDRKYEFVHGRSEPRTHINGESLQNIAVPRMSVPLGWYASTWVPKCPNWCAESHMKKSAIVSWTCSAPWPNCQTNYSNGHIFLDGGGSYHAVFRYRMSFNYQSTVQLLTEMGLSDLVSRSCYRPVLARVHNLTLVGLILS